MTDTTLIEYVAEIIKKEAAIHSLNGHPTDGFVGNPNYLAQAAVAAVIERLSEPTEESAKEVYKMFAGLRLRGTGGVEAVYKAMLAAATE